MDQLSWDVLAQRGLKPNNHKEDFSRGENWSQAGAGEGVG